MESLEGAWLASSAPTTAAANAVRRLRERWEKSAHAKWNKNELKENATDYHDSDRGENDKKEEADAFEDKCHQMITTATKWQTNNNSNEKFTYYYTHF